MLSTIFETIINKTSNSKYEFFSKIITILLIVIPSTLSGQTIYVDFNASGANNGSSWANAYINLQSALDNAGVNNEIWVAQGTYHPTASPDGTTTFPRDRAFHFSTDMKIYGGFDGTETLLTQRDWINHVTTLSGDFNNDDQLATGAGLLLFPNNTENAYHVLVTTKISSDAVIDGFTVKGGNANGNGDIQYASTNFLRGYGGGMNNDIDSDLTIANLTFTQNSASYNGGAMNNDGSSPAITSTTFLNNKTLGSGGGIHSEFGSFPVITNSTFTNNHATFNGGAMYNSNTDPTISNSTFSKNYAGETGGAISNEGGTPVITNTVFWENNCSNQGGALFTSSGAPIVNNSTFAFNKAIQGGGGIFGTTIVTNTIFWGNEINGDSNTTGADMQLPGTGTYPMTNCLTQTYSSGSNLIINQDPQFGDATNGDLRLVLGSPAINTGDGIMGSSVNMTTLDLAGNPRFEGIIDIGAYEGGLCPEVIYVDMDASGLKNGTSWSNAFTDLQDALDLSCEDVVEIWVAEGTYLPTRDHLGNTSPLDNRSKSFHISSDKKVYGGFDGTETSLAQRDFKDNVTILSGDLNNDDTNVGNSENAHHVLLTVGLTTSAVVDGFTIIGGNANNASSITYESLTISSQDGGGLYNVSEANFNNLTFKDNNATFGGGMYNFNSSAKITNAYFNSNSATNGGGMANYTNGNPTIINSIFANNTATSGGGIYNLFNSAPSIINATITDNSAANGGGVFNQNSSPSITNTIFWANERDGSTTTSGADIADVVNSSPTITYSLTQLFSAYSTGTGIINNQQPIFLDPTNGDFDIAGHSPAINKGDGTVGNSVNTSTTDAAGNARFDGIIDMGAFEGGDCPSALYVDINANGSKTGVSWTNAYDNLQDAINANICDSDIWVAAGTYLPTQTPTGSDFPNRDKTFRLAADMKIYGGFEGTETDLSQRDWVANETILSGDFNGNDGATGSGASLNLSNNTENAFHVFITANLTSAAVIDGFTIKGGYAKGGTTSITYENGNYEKNDGGGLYNISSSPTLANLVFEHNRAISTGGAICNINSSPNMTNSIIKENQANFAGGIYNQQSSGSFTNCTLYGNYATASGGGMRNIISSSPSVTNCTFSNNASSEGAGMFNSTSSPTIINTIFWNNKKNGNNSVSGADIYDDANSAPTVTYSITQANSVHSTGVGIINNENPLFVDVSSEDYRLIIGSPAIDSGDGIDNNSANTTSLDLGGNSRFEGVIDMGPYEGGVCITMTSTIYVDIDANGTNNGSSWNNAFTDLQDALDNNCNNSEVWVAEGTYFPTSSPDGTSGDDRKKSFHLSDEMKIYGGFQGTETQLSERDMSSHETILSGDFNENDIVTGSGSSLSITGKAENALRVLLVKGVTSASIIDGFTIQGGNANDGAGNITYAGQTFNNQDGGGVYNSSNAIFSNLIFRNNNAIFGGGMYNWNSSPTVSNTMFADNLGSNGGGIFNFNIGSPDVINCIFSGNKSFTSGGGMSSLASSAPTVTNSTFVNNNAINGGGIYHSSSTLVVTNSIFWNNEKGGNNDVEGADIENNGGTPTVTYCLTQANSTYDTGTGIINNELPVFVDINNENFNLQPCSPAINSGTTTTHTNDFIGNPHVGNVDLGAFEYQEEPLVLTIDSTSVTQAMCPDSTGSIVVNATSNLETLEYSLDNGVTYQSSSSFSDLPPGSYMVKVRLQGSLCTEVYGNNPVIIDPLPSLLISTPTVSHATCPDLLGTIEVNATLNFGILEYSIDNGLNYQSSNIFNEEAPGTYFIKVREQGSTCAIAYVNNPVVINAPFTDAIYVNGNAVGNNDGTSWTNAYTDLQDAIDNQCGEFDIWVAAGTYYPTKDHTGNGSPSDDRDKNFHLSSDMKIYGGFDGTETLLAERDWTNNLTILSGDIDNATDPDVVTGSGSTLLITGNMGNAYHVFITADLTTTSVIDGFSIIGGNADGGGGVPYQSNTFNRADGGGICNVGSSASMANLTFLNNSAIFGGGMYNDSLCSPVITNSIFKENEGIGMYNNHSSSPMITNSIFKGNEYVGLRNDNSSSPTITNSIFAENENGMINFENSSPTITNSTFANNTGYGGSGAMFNLASASPIITNCIFWNNTVSGNNNVPNADIRSLTNSNPVISYCLTQENSNYSSGTGIINNQDPLFVDVTNGDYSLGTGSPCINTGDGVEGSSVNTDTLDLVANPRFVDVIDMGAYENQCKLNLVLGMDDSPLSGTYKAGQSIIIDAAVQVMPGAILELSAPMVKLDALMNLGSGANLIIKPDGCN